MKEKEEAPVLTDEQLWDLCIEEENKTRVIHDYYRDKAVDYDQERFIWEKWNPREWK